jgi:HD-GYP domain-containing protein (c-di-GMP phosphodiesterase class II)
MRRALQIVLWDLAVSLAEAADLVSPLLANHHKQVAFIAQQLGLKLDMPRDEVWRIGLAAAMHDIGALSLAERIHALDFELQAPHEHARRGAILLSLLNPVVDVASIVRFHHVPWNNGKGEVFDGVRVPMHSHLLHLADRVAVSLNVNEEPLGQRARICNLVCSHSGDMFVPDHVDALLSLKGQEWFWLDARRVPFYSIRQSVSVELEWPDLLLLGRLFAHMIDFRSHFTATHSAGVAATAEAMATLLGFSETECLMMRLAGDLHDLGKLAVPTEILEKPAKLDESETNIMRAHTYHTFRVLEPIAALRMINEWASYHHERLDGTGYPFHLSSSELGLGSRIMAVADVFTAIMEDRPYRKGMDSREALAVIKKMGRASALDEHVIAALEKHFDEVNSRRSAAQQEAAEEYAAFLA